MAPRTELPSHKLVINLFLRLSTTLLLRSEVWLDRLTQLDLVNRELFPDVLRLGDTEGTLASRREDKRHILFCNLLYRCDGLTKKISKRLRAEIREIHRRLPM